MIPQEDIVPHAGLRRQRDDHSSDILSSLRIEDISVPGNNLPSGDESNHDNEEDRSPPTKKNMS